MCCVTIQIKNESVVLSGRFSWLACWLERRGWLYTACKAEVSWAKVPNEETMK